MRPLVRPLVASTGNRAPSFPPSKSLAVYAARLRVFICDYLTNNSAGMKRKRPTGLGVGLFWVLVDKPWAGHCNQIEWAEPL